MCFDKNIRAARKACGLSQEALAEQLGVSRQAVSKWESAAAYPDILLLPELARALRTSVDALLGLSPALTEAEREKAAQACRDVFNQSGWAAGLAACEETIGAHPEDMQLRVAMASVLMYGAVFIRTDGEAAQYRQAQEAFLHPAAERGEGEARRLARYMLGYCYLQANRLADAERLLQDLQGPAFDAESLLAMLRLKQGRLPEAEVMAQRQLLGAVAQAQGALSTLVTLAIEQQDAPRALALSDALDALFAAVGLQARMGMHAAQLRLSASSISGDTNAMQAAVEAFARGFATENAPWPAPCFDRLGTPDPEEQAKAHEALREIALRNLETNAAFDPVRDRPAFQAALEALRAQAE